MRLTNKYDLPSTIARAIRRKNASYDRGPAHRSVTQLIQPPRIDLLRKRHWDEIEKDVSDEWWALFGSAVHYILELGADEKEQVAEERIYTDIDGWVVSGMLDCQTYLHDDHVDIVDYKVTAAYNVTKHEDGPKPEWVQQMNLQAYLVEREKGLPVRNMHICAILRDWVAGKAQDPLYPVAPIITIPIPLWPFEEREAFFRERMNAHRTAEMHADLDLALPECTDEERWLRDHKWAVMKKGSKRAKKVCSSHDEAVAILSTVDEKTHYIEERPGTNARCLGNFCQVSQWCEQYARIKDEQAKDI